MEARNLISTITALLIGIPAVVYAAPPSMAPSSFTVCYGFECGRHQQVSLTPSQWQDIRAIFTPPAADAEQERALIRRAIAQMETLVGTLTGTWRDKGGNTAGSGQPKQMDCIDESTNTTTYLSLFQQDGLLNWHEATERSSRARWILDIHWTGVIRETASGQLYAVDSWFLDNGEPPYIQRLDDWKAKKKVE